MIPVAVGPVFPIERNLTFLVGVGFALGYMAFAGARLLGDRFEHRLSDPRAEVFRRRGGAVVAIAAALYWLVAVLVGRKFSVGPRPPNLFEVGSAFATGPAIGASVAYWRKRGDPDGEERFGFDLGVLIGLGAAIWECALWANAS
jgi:hypothetical protein